MADKEGMERKVYLLPKELVDRIQAYQQGHNISSEVEAARRLLDAALQMRDNVILLLEKLEARFQAEKDLRVLAKDVLAAHPLVTKIHFDESELSFTMRSSEMGMIRSNGNVFYRPVDAYGDDWVDYTHQRLASLQKKSREKGFSAEQKKTASSSSWDAKPIDLDDEIPF